MRLLAALLILFSLTAPAAAGELEDALDAYFSGDYETAFRLWKPLAEGGDVDAQAELGSMYYWGAAPAVPQDYAEALKWFRMAAEQGRGLAQHRLGEMYMNGEGVPQDFVKAYMWWSLADATLLESLAQIMTPDQIAEAQKLAREWQPSQ